MTRTATSEIIWGRETTPELETLLAGINNAGLESTMDFNREKTKSLLHNLNTQWTIVLGYLDCAKTEATRYDSKDTRYDSIYELANKFYTQTQRMINSAVTVGIDGSMFSNEITDLQKKLKIINDNVVKIDDKKQYSQGITAALENISNKLDKIAHITYNDSFKIEKKEFDVEEAIEEAKNQVYELAARKNIRITVNCDYKGSINTNRIAFINSIIENYLSNAIKYSKQGKEVTINAYQNGDEVVIKVADNGIGMTEDEASKAFDEGYMAPIDLNELQRLNLHTNYRSGFGLSLAKKIAERLEGRVSVASQKGKGSTFYLNMPLGIKDKQCGELVTAETESAHYAA